MNKYLDRTGTEIAAGDMIESPDGVIMKVHACMDQHGNEDLGILATNPNFLKRHPDHDLEFYSLNQIGVKEWQIVDFADPIR